MDTDKLMRPSNEEIAAARAKAEALINTLTWPELWAIAAAMGWKDDLGGHEYESATLERLGELCESKGGVR